MGTFVIAIKYLIPILPRINYVNVSNSNMSTRTARPKKEYKTVA